MYSFSMIKFDFSEARQNWTDLKARLGLGGEAVASQSPESLQGALVAKLDTKDAVMWIVFAVISVSSTIMILIFIDSFSVEQEKYQSVLTSIGRSPAEYRALMTETGTGTRALQP